jgi:hypothetical protein
LIDLVRKERGGGRRGWREERVEGGGDILTGCCCCCCCCCSRGNTEIMVARAALYTAGQLGVKQTDIIKINQVK